MTRYWLMSLGVSLGLTLAIELAFAALCRKRGRALLMTALVNLLTNPVVVFCSLLWKRHALPAYWAAVAFLEVLAFLTEGFIYKKSREFSRPYVFSLCANALSFGTGLVLKYLL